MTERTYTFRRPEGLLAHYTKADTAFRHILPTGKLRMSPYRDMRDPTENKDIVPGMASRGATLDPESVRDVIGRIKLARDDCRLLSFTREASHRIRRGAFACCWARPRMWEQYGDVHTGACLVFDQARLEAVLDNELGPLGKRRDVDYTPEGIAESATRNFYDSRISDPAKRQQAIEEYIQTNHRDFFFLKSSDFETELEYRVVLTRPATGDAYEGYSDTPLRRPDEYVHVRFADALVAVVVGERFPDWQVAGALDACRKASVDAKANVELRKIGWWPHGDPRARDIKFPPGHEPSDCGS